jgi:hypothetical protein
MKGCKQSARISRIPPKGWRAHLRLSVLLAEIAAYGMAGVFSLLTRDLMSTSIEDTGSHRWQPKQVVGRHATTRHTVHEARTKR